MSSLANKLSLESLGYRAMGVDVTEDELIVFLEDGREFRTPIEFFPKLARSSMEVRRNHRLIGPGVGIEWPDLDEHLSIKGIVLGLPVIDW